ncbi:MAG: prepilin-type N-terminal cleavage/methylation domain-containing protein [Kofleriaceae bacterium]|nr:prepilin-type N-terminal cleavage/methylation domain-containing protein [Myxococcales bacterium]MCB9562421.1 prepilin-type N-terminal cleavage/methylation domain-containing protein [Kofleriaceae bacterium]
MHRIIKNKQRGFTLIELMIVVAIIGILAAVAIPAFLDYMKKSKRSEAELNLDAIKKSARTGYIENSTFPQAASGLTPAAACCNGPGKKCAVLATDWQGNPAWDALDFAIDDPFYFQYEYTSAVSNVYQATATGDLDCDGVSVVYTLDGDAADGRPKSTLTKPARAD